MHPFFEAAALARTTPRARPDRVTVLDRLHARLAAQARPATGFVALPDPCLIGQVARGQQLLAGQVLIRGTLVQAGGRSIWEVAEEVARGPVPVQGFTWLDDLAAVGDARARAVAQAWLADWIVRYGAGRGPGWTPELAGRRLIRWIIHAGFLRRGQDKAAAEAYYRSAARQTIFLSRRWQAAPTGLPRFEALAGLIHAGLSLQGMQARVAPAVAALAADCRGQIGRDGAIAARSPEDLLHILSLLTAVQAALTKADRPLPEALRSAIDRIAPTLRALRHADGGLARFHGGGSGPEGRLDQALAASGNRGQPRRRLHMGYGRLARGRTTVVMDAASPPGGAAAGEAHAATLAFELTSGRRPLIVNCGSGRSFGPEWRRAGRATPSHSTLVLEGGSSARISQPARDGVEPLDDVPGDVRAEFSRLADGLRLGAAHDGYRRSHGLTHVRTLDLAHDGRSLAGEDLLTILEYGDQPVLDAALDRTGPRGLAWALHFHLHPEVAAELDSDSATVSLSLKSGEVWVFRPDGAATLNLEPSVYLEDGRLRPRATQQVVLSGRAMSYATRVRWSLAKAQDTPLAVRDLEDRLPGTFADGTD
jgi:uncharacterized heparinase superfamily protein